MNKQKAFGRTTGGGPRLQVAIGFCTERGARPANEDFVGWLGDGADGEPAEGVAAAVADGVGGAKGGRVAAEAAVRLFLDAQFGQRPSGRRSLDAQARAVSAVDAANRWVHAVGRVDPALEGMACTFTALLLRGRRATVLHVGDSRLYRLRDGELRQFTTDHVAAGHAMRHVLTRAVGAEAALRVEATAFSARVHDRYLLCSDGVWGGVPDRAIRAALAARSGVGETARALVQAALDARIGDNATALVLDVIDLAEPNASELAAEMDRFPILATPKSGASVDGFRLGTTISDGRHSRVFRAEDGDGRKLILKFPKSSAAEPALRQAFLREAWIAARLDIPGVAAVIEVPADRRSCLYTVMPRYDGETLEQRLRRPPPVPLAAGVSIAVRLARAVAGLHRAGVIHRDIKPDNILLESGGGLRLLDLGVARLPSLEDVPDAETPGTPSYMAPEMFGGADGDAATDIYALGVTLYRMFAASYPYGEVEAFARPRFGRPTALAVHRPDLPSWLGQVLATAVALRPQDRYRDAVELAWALEHGALRAAPARPARRSLLERDPARFYAMLSLLLTAVLAAVVAWAGLRG